MFWRRRRKQAKSVATRPEGETSARAVAGSEGADTPFFSPDGQWLGMYGGGKIKKVPLGGGPTATVAQIARRARRISHETAGIVPQLNQMRVVLNVSSLRRAGEQREVQSNSRRGGGCASALKLKYAFLLTVLTGTFASA